MPVNGSRLGPGDAVFHPKYGFGTVHSLLQRDRVHSIHESTLVDPQGEHTEDYYDIALIEGGTLLVPVRQAENVGLRRLTNGLADVTANLCSPPESLPANSRERSAILRMREQLAQPEALAQAVRDMVGQSRGRNLSEGEKLWLDKACQRLSTEVALVDRLSVGEARAAVWAVVSQL